MLVNHYVIVKPFGGTVESLYSGQPIKQAPRYSGLIFWEPTESRSTLLANPLYSGHL